MKTASILAISTCILLSCKTKESEVLPVSKEIIYPNLGNYGTNILNADTVIFTKNKNYSLRAEMPNGKKLRMVIINNSDSVNARQPGNKTIFYNGQIYGWKTISTKAAAMEYLVEDAVKAEMTGYFTIKGAIKIELYEDGATTPTRVKEITWK